MAIDPRLSLAVQPLNTASTFNNLLSNIGQVQQMERQAQLAPIQLESAQLGLQQAQRKEAQQAQMDRIQSVALGAAEILPDLKLDNPQAALAKLQARRQRLIDQGIPTNDTDQAIQMLSTPEGQLQLTSDAENAVNLGERLGVFGAAGQQGVPAQMQRFNTLLKIAQDPNSTKLEKNSARRELGDLARISTSARERIASDPDLTKKVAESESVITGQKEEAKQEAQLRFKPEITKAVKKAELDAKARGDVNTDLIKQEAALPGIKQVVSQLKVLSEDATFTLAGKGFNAIAKEFGFSTKGDTARKGMTSIVDNQVLPLLKPIFGAAFTAQEGDRLRNAFLDPDSTPDSRKAALDAFLGQMQRNIETLRREKAAREGGGQQINLESLTQEDLGKLSLEQLKQLEQGQ